MRRHENAIVLFVIAAVAIPAAIALPLVWTHAWDVKTRLTLTLAIVLGSGGLVMVVRARVMRPLQTLANLTASLREKDYSVRGRGANRGRNDDALGLAVTELSHLAEELRAERWRDEETSAGLSRVVESLDAAVVAIDDAGIIRMANRTAERVAGKVGEELGIELRDATTPRTVELAGGTWEVRPSDVRLAGRPHRLLVMTDVQHALRAEERQAWQRLVRVLGHEINNSLGPIASIAETLRVGIEQKRPDIDIDLSRGLEVIERRAAALARFMKSYARLVRLPPPRIGRVEVATWIGRTVAPLFAASAPLEVVEGPAIAIAGDGDQLDQLLINLVHNAVEATTTGVRVTWSVAAGAVTVVVDDDGPGVADTANLFVPFFTTKPNGSGIGLPLARQIAEAHGGSLVLRNRKTARGAEAIVTLPIGRAPDPSLSP